MPLPALPHARVVWLTRLHERGSDWLSIFSNIAEHKKKYLKNIYISERGSWDNFFFFFFFLDFRISKEKNKNKKNIFSVVLIGGIFLFFIFF